MTTDENILEEMLERSTNPRKDDVDNMAVQMFCMIVNSNKGDLVNKAHELIVKKIRSQNITEANRAIGVLEECMSKGGEEFQKKTAKFSFLNELIALVLDRHTGPAVPVETKKRIMECLMLWTVEHSDRPKFQEAYDNLKKQVNFNHGPPPSINVNATTSMGNGSAVRDQRSSILGKDDMLFAKLLKQGGEENYKKANLVLQHRFNQEARRTEFICHLKAELKKIESTMEVLEEMLNSYCTDTPGQDTQELMQELYHTCKSHNEQMARWPDFLGESEEPNFLVDILSTKDLLMGILQRYKDLMENNPATHVEETLTKDSLNSNVTLTNTRAAASSTTTTSNTDILSELLGGAISSTNSSPRVEQQKVTKDNGHTTLDELTEIFGCIDTTKTEQTKYPSDLLGNFDLLEPINVFGSETKNSTTSTEKSDINEECEKQKPQGFKELREIDKLSEEIFKQSLQSEQRQTTFKKEPEKITLNDLAKDKIQASLKTNTNDKKTSLESLSDSEDQDILDCKKDTVLQMNTMDIAEKIILDDAQKQETEQNANITEESKKPVVVATPKPLAEITVDIDDLTPEKECQVLLDDEDIQVSLNLAADRPTPHVTVIVMSVTNKSHLPMEDIHFEASVRKPCKVRLLAPTATRRAPRKPFRPSEPINQIVLLMNPTEKPVDVTYIVGYKLGDDPDPIKVSTIAKDIPYV